MITALIRVMVVMGIPQPWRVILIVTCLFAKDVAFKYNDDLSPICRRKQPVVRSRTSRLELKI